MLTISLETPWNQKPNPQEGKETLRMRSAKAVPTGTPLDTIPGEYLGFHDVFSGKKANVLAPHCLCDLKINLEEGAKPFHRLVYSLSPPKLYQKQVHMTHIRKCLVRGNRALRALGGLKAPRGLRAQGDKP